MSAKGKLCALSAILSILALGLNSCSTPANVRHGNRTEYLVKETESEVVNNSEELKDLSGADSDDELNFIEDLQEVRENNGESIPQISKTEADEIAELTKNLFERNPKKKTQSEVEESSTKEYDYQHKEKAATGLPTLQNQIDAIKETYIAQDEKIEAVKTDVASVKADVIDIKKDISELKNEVKALANQNTSTTNTKVNPTSTAKSKTVKGYKLLSDEELEKKDNTPAAPQTKTETDVEEDISSGRTDGNLDELKKSMSYKVAMNSISKKDYKNATIQLNRLKTEFPSGEAGSEIDYWIGEAAFGMKQYKKALSAFRSSANISSERADDASAMIAECMIKLGRVKEAKQEYKDFIAQYPSSKLVPRARKMLQQL